MSKGISRIQTLSKLVDADATTFDSSLRILTKADLVRLVGLLQQSMLEEERRFSLLSQCLQELNSKQAASIVPVIRRRNNYDDEDDDNAGGTGAHLGPQLLNSESVLNESSTVRFRNSNINNGQNSGFGGNVMASSIAQVSTGLSTFRDVTDHCQPLKAMDDPCFTKLSIQWDNAHIADEHNSQCDTNGNILRIQLEDGLINSDEEIFFEELEMKVRAEQERRDYLARELCLSQSRLAQLCAKNMKIYNLQREHRRLYGLDDYSATSPATVAISPSVDECLDQTEQISSAPLTSASQQQTTRKSLSTLHKEKKLKELSSDGSNHTDITTDALTSRVDILRQQALQTVLTDILAASGDSNNGRVVEVSPESGYNSSSSLKSPSSVPVVGGIGGSSCVFSNRIRQLSPQLQQQQQTPKPAKFNELELSASRERILEQVRSRRSSAPPNQHLSNKRATTNSPQRPNPSVEQRPLKSILKKRQPEVISRSVENGIHQNDYQSKLNDPTTAALKRSSLIGCRSSSYSDEGYAKRISIVANATDVKRDDSSDLQKLSQNSKRISVSDTMTSPVRSPASPPMPAMASTPELASNDSPVPFVHHVDYPSPIRNGGSSDTSGKHGDLPDVVVLNIADGSAVNQIQTPPQSSSSEESDRARVVDYSPSRKFPAPTLSPRTQPELANAKFAHEHRSSSKEEAGANIENDVFQEWDPRPLLRELYTVRYEGQPDVKRRRFVNMEGPLEHLPMNIRAVIASETMWRKHYFRTNEGRLQWFEDAHGDPLPFGEIALTGAEVDVDKNAYMFVVRNVQEGQSITIRCSPHLLDKWRSALLSHASASSCVNFVRPVYPPIPHADENVVVIEIGSCSIRAGLLTSEPSLPQAYFPSIACILPDGTIVAGFDSLSPSVRHDGTIVHPITPTQLAVNRYSMDLEIVKHLFRKTFQDLQIDPQAYQVLLSVPQNAPVGMVGDMMRALLSDFSVRGVSVSRQPFLILYAYDVTTGVVVDFGDRLNIVPVIDGYVVQSAIVSLPYGGHNVSEGLRAKLIERNWASYSFMSEVEKYILRYVMEKACYIASEFDDEALRYDQNPSQIETYVNIEQFQPTPEMPKGYSVDAARFTSTEGIFKPKRWGFDIDGLHKLIYHAIQSSPLDSRRVLYRNIYLAGGASLIPGLVERLESELTPLVASSVQVRVRTSPWRDHAAFIGAQILAGGIQFEQQLIKDTSELEKFIRRLYTANF